MLQEVHAASSIIQQAAHEDANIIFGAVLDAEMKDRVKITVIATGFKEGPGRSRRKSVTEAASAVAKMPAPWDVHSSSSQSAASHGAMPHEDLEVPTFLRRRREEAS